MKRELYCYYAAIANSVVDSKPKSLVHGRCSRNARRMRAIAPGGVL